MRAEGHVGVPLNSQLVLVSHAHTISQPVTLKRIRILFEGGIRSIELNHNGEEVPNQEDKTSNFQFQDIELGKKTSSDATLPLSPTSPGGQISLTGFANLSIAAGSTKILFVSDVPRTGGEVEVSSITLLVSEKDFDLELLITEDKDMQQDAFIHRRGKRIAPNKFSRRRSYAINILPKPPKLRLELTGFGKECYTDEELNLAVNVVNDEEEVVEMVLDARLLGPPETTPHIEWLEEQHFVNSPKMSIHLEQNDSQNVLGRLAPSINQRYELRVSATSQPADYNLEVRARYYLESDRETLVMKSALTPLSLRQPFEATTTFSPIIHPDAWPDYFAISDGHNIGEAMGDETKCPNGLAQKWSATVRITSLATVPINLESVEIEVAGVHEEAVCTTSREDLDVSGFLPPAEVQEHHFSLNVQKMELEDRRSVFLDLRVKILWRQDGSPRPTTATFLPMPEFAIPFGEPRVLASARNGSSPQTVIHLTYTLENPSNYHLSFSITMEQSDEFAFSGAKSTTVHLVPLSRQSIQYNLLPLVKGVWVSPQLRVYDTQFHKMLKVQGTEGMRNEKKGPSIWVDVDG